MSFSDLILAGSPISELRRGGQKVLSQGEAGGYWTGRKSQGNAVSFTEMSILCIVSNMFGEEMKEINNLQARKSWI